MFIIDDPQLVKYLKYAHDYAWEQFEHSIGERKNFWENEAHNLEHLILELEPEWVVGT